MSVGLGTKYYSFVFDSGNISILKVTEIHDVIYDALCLWELSR